MSAEEEEETLMTDDDRSEHWRRQMPDSFVIQLPDDPVERAEFASEMRVRSEMVVSWWADIRALSIADAVWRGTPPHELARRWGVTGGAITAAMVRVRQMRDLTADELDARGWPYSTQDVRLLIAAMMARKYHARAASGGDW